jgi:phenylacetate-coenzyme A ligase PaaK-like adenylate-forming protein
MKSLKEHLYELVNFHISATPFWQNKKKDLDSVFEGKTIEIIENLFNEFLVDENLLKERWLEFLPKNYSGNIRFYQSSGTTGKRKIVHWSEKYTDLLITYLKSSLDRFYEPKIKRALIQGPYGWYQEEMSKLIWSYGAYLYFVGIETEGLKVLLEKEGFEGVKEMFKPLLNYTQRVLEKDKEVNTVRTAPQILSFFLPYKTQIENIIVSGTEVNSENLNKIREDFPNAKIIPFYGHFLFGDAIGIVEGKSIHYYPNFPYTIIEPLKMEEGRLRVVKYGEEGKLGIIVLRPELFFVTVEEEKIRRIGSGGLSHFDGFSNPKKTAK